MEKKEEGEEHLGPIPEQLYLKSSWVIPQSTTYDLRQSQLCYQSECLIN